MFLIAICMDIKTKTAGVHCSDQSITSTMSMFVALYRDYIVLFNYRLFLHKIILEKMLKDAAALSNTDFN